MCDKIFFIVMCASDMALIKATYLLTLYSDDMITPLIKIFLRVIQKLSQSATTG